MFKKIKEFIKAFKDAYHTININKFNAKIAIEDYRKEVERFSNAANTMYDIYDNLIAVYKYFPIKERQDFIQKTLDLISYGRKDSNGNLTDICGMRAVYYIEADNMKNNLTYLKNLYNGGKYNEVIVETKKFSNQLEEFYILYDIKETQNEENE